MAKKLSASSPRVELTSVKPEDISNRKWTDRELRALRRAARLQAAGDDSDINYDDIPALTGKQLASMVRLREIRRKVPVSVRLDPEVIQWLKAKGAGHLTRINDILTNLMEAERRSSAKTGPRTAAGRKRATS